MKRIIFILIILSSCGIPELKKLNSESEKDVDSLFSELNLKDMNYGIYHKFKNGKQKNYFKIRLFDVNDTIDCEKYNMRIIKIFDKSGFNLKQFDFVVFYYYKDYSRGKLYKFYRINASNGYIIEESGE